MRNPWSIQDVVGLSGSSELEWIDLDALSSIPFADKLTEKNRASVEEHRRIVPACAILPILDRLAPPPLAEPWALEKGTPVRGWMAGKREVIGHYQMTVDGQAYVTLDKEGKFNGVRCSRVEPLREGGKP
jgi:hypothetical protein